MARRSTSAAPLTLAYAALVLYASLYPFGPWRWPPALDGMHLLVLPWPPWTDLFDLWSNLLGYLPLGALLVLAARRSGLSWMATWVLSVFAAAALSYGAEVAQQCLPGRHPSLKDLALNTAGAAAGGLLALAAHQLGWVDRWQQTRERWFARDSAGALALLALWPVGLMFPTPVPLGMGQVLDHLRDGLSEWLQDVPWALTAHAMLAAPALDATPLSPLADAGITALGLLAPCLVAYSVVQPGWRRVALAAGALGLAVATMALATALNYGPQHAAAWLTPFTVPGLGCGFGLACLLAALPRRLVAGVGLMVLTSLVVGVSQAPDDPYFAQSLQAWEQGRFIRFHGVAQWVGWLWPFTAMAWLFTRLASRERRF
jgi:VanZ family protein